MAQSYRIEGEDAGSLDDQDCHHLDIIKHVLLITLYLLLLMWINMCYSHIGRIVSHISYLTSLLHAIHARTLRLEQSMALIPPPPLRVPLSSSELLIVASFWLIRSAHIFFVFRIYVVSLQARSCNEMGFP